MGTLIAMRLPTPLAAWLADHTYVQCSAGKGWMLKVLGARQYGILFEVPPDVVVRLADPEIAGPVFERE